MTIVKIENVRVLDPIQQTDSVQTVYIENGKLIAETAHASEVIDGQGKWLMPTMVDLCARLREPGQRDGERLVERQQHALCHTARRPRGRRWRI